MKPEHIFAHKYLLDISREDQNQSIYFSFKLIQKHFKVQIPKSDAKRNES